MQRPSLTPVHIDTFDPQSLKEGYEQKSVSTGRSNKTLESSKFGTDQPRPSETLIREETSVSDPLVPLNSDEGYSVSLESFANLILRIKMSAAKKGYTRERPRVPLSLHIRMLDIEGTPDMYVLSDRKVDEFGIENEPKVWHSKRELTIHPNDPGYIFGIYFVKIVSGIDKCKCRIVAKTILYTPMMDNARLGPGGGFRPSTRQKSSGFGSLVLASVESANRRRLMGKMGRDPFQGRGFCISNMRTTKPASADEEANHHPTRSTSGFSSQAASEIGEASDASTFNHALQVSCRTSLERVRFGKFTPIRDVTVRDFFSVLNPNRAKEAAHSLPAFHEPEEANEKRAMSPSLARRLSIASVRAESPRSKARGVGSEPVGAAPSGAAKRSFGAALMELLSAADVYRSTTDRFRWPLTECLTVYVPVAKVPGFAVLSGDGLSRRQILPSEGGPVERVRSGEAVSLQPGSLVPPDCDAVVAFGTSRMVGKDAFMPTLPVAEGMNVDFECSAFFEQLGAFVPADDFIRAHFPGSLHGFEKLRRRHARPGRPGGARFESLPIEIEAPLRRRAERAQPLEMTALVVAAVDCSLSPLFAALHAEERSRLAYGAKVHAVAPGAVIAREGEWIKYVGQPARSVLMLLRGAVAETVPSDPSPAGRADASPPSPAARVVRTERGYVIGAGLLLSNEPWPGDVHAETACALAEFTAASLLRVIMTRPEILDDLDEEPAAAAAAAAGGAVGAVGGGEAFDSGGGGGGGGGGVGGGGSGTHDALLGPGGLSRHQLPRDARRQESLAAQDAAARKLRAARLERLQSLLRHDPLETMAALRWWEEEKWNDRLIAMGALCEKDLALVRLRRLAMEEGAGPGQQETGAGPA